MIYEMELRKNDTSSNKFDAYHVLGGRDQYIMKLLTEKLNGRSKEDELKRLSILEDYFEKELAAE